MQAREIAPRQRENAMRISETWFHREFMMRGEGWVGANRNGFKAARSSIVQAR
jgi:hypothetical protein